MTSLSIAVVILGALFGSALVGMAIGWRLPPHHLTTETRNVVSVSMAVVGTMSALVIGFLISNASSSFNARNGAVAHLSSDMVRLDATLRRYGPEADPARRALQGYANARFNDLFANGLGRKPTVDNPVTVKLLDDVQDHLLTLKPGDDRQRWLGAQALQLAADVGAGGSMLVQQNTSSLPLPFVGAVMLWLTVVFASFGLFAPRNATTLVALFLCAFAVAAALKLVLDLDTPFEGGIHMAPPPIHLSSEPLRDAVDALGR